MVRRACAILGDKAFTGLYDKGYHTGSELQACHDMGVDVLVSPPRENSGNTPRGFRLSDMAYDRESDTYTCPAGAVLTTNGKLYKKSKGGYRAKQYKTKSCAGCPLRSQCTQSKTGRVLERSEFADAVWRNKEAVSSNPEVYRKRQQIVEHPYGTMKRNWGFDHIMTKRGKRRASADMGLVFTAYNLRRLLSLIGGKGLLERLHASLLLIFGYFWVLFRPYAENEAFSPLMLIFLPKLPKIPISH